MSKISLFGLIKDKDKRNNHTFSEEDREHSYELRSLKLQLKKEQLQLEAERNKIRLQAEIEEARQQLADLTDTEEEDTPSGSSVDNALLAIAAKVLAGNNPTPPYNPISAEVAIPSNKPDLSQAQLQQIWDNLPQQYQKAARKMKDNELKKVILFQYPQATEADIGNAIDFIRHN